MKKLSNKEVQVLDLIKEGLTNAQIAERCCNSEKTIENHIRSILRKLYVDNRLQATVTGLKLGIIEF